MSDSLQIKVFQDSLSGMNQSINLIQEQNHTLQIKIDSVIQINSNLKISENYFSDIIDTQMDWFGIFFVVTFGVLGLVYWYGLFRYFKKQNILLNEKISTNKINIEQDVNSNKVEIHKKVDLNKSETERNLNETKKDLKEIINKIDDKHVELNQGSKDLIEEKLKSLNENLDNVTQNSEKIISNSTKELKELITTQNISFEETRKNLMKSIMHTDYNSQKAMYFHNYQNNNFNNALSWGVTILKLIVVDNYKADATPWIESLKTCIDKAKYTVLMENNYHWIVDLMKEIKNKAEDPERINKMENLIDKYSSIYFAGKSQAKK